MIQTFLESIDTHVDHDGRRRPQLRLRGNSVGFWVERRRSALIVDRVMSVYDRIDTYWTNSLDDAARRFMRIPAMS